jgi:hypothetical protein
MQDDRDKEVHTTGSQHNVGQEEADRLGVGIHHTPEGIITVEGPPGTFSIGYRPSYTFVMKDGVERKVTDACGEYFDLRRQMIIEFQTTFPEVTTQHLYNETLRIIATQI